MPDEQLKPCPFCGHIEDDPETSVVPNEYGQWVYFCSSCGAEGPLVDEVSAVTAWNTRAAPKVKPLDWHSTDVIPSRPTWSAEGLGGVYVIDYREKHGFYRLLWASCRSNEFHPTLEAAKAAAQADYERRILDALE